MCSINLLQCNRTSSFQCKCHWDKRWKQQQKSIMGTLSIWWRKLSLATLHLIFRPTFKWEKIDYSQSLASHCAFTKSFLLGKVKFANSKHLWSLQDSLNSSVCNCYEHNLVLDPSICSCYEHNLVFDGQWSFISNERQTDFVCSKWIIRARNNDCAPDSKQNM